VDDQNSPPEEHRQRLSAETFDECFQQFSGGIRAFLKSKLGNEADVEDCFSRVFEKLWTHGASVNGAAIGPWLFVVAKREVALHWRKQKSREAAIERASRDTAEFDDCQTVDGLIQQERVELLRAAAADLPDDQQELLRRRFIDGDSFRTIAEELGLPLGTALSRLHAALRRLKAKLNPDS
jgi:RNA polymerase sigma-70 factor (ECF subfamily)